MNRTRASAEFFPSNSAHFDAQHLNWTPFLAILLAVGLGWFSSLGRSDTKVPGPRGIPIFGNLLEIRNGQPMYASWSKQYKEVFRVVLGNRDVVMLNTRSAVAKTLMKQGVAFQSRPEWGLWHQTFVQSANTGGVLTMGTAGWTPDITRMRKSLGPYTTAQRMPRYSHFVSRRYFGLIKRLSELSGPTDLGTTLWITAVGLVTDSMVGVRHDDDFVKLIAETELGVFRLRALGYRSSDWVPILSVSEQLGKIVTSSLRGATSLLRIPTPKFLINEQEAKCNDLRANQARYCYEQLTGLKERLENGDPTPSQIGDMFRTLSEPLPYHEQYLLMTTTSGSGMAIGTTLNWLMGYLAAHPELQEKAYNAIHEVYNGAAPDPHDSDRVEYIKALFMEAGRYWTPMRLGFYRETTEDAHIDEHFIPKGTMVVYNSYLINRDPMAYDSPNEFIPERWMNGHQGRTDTTEVVDKIGVPHLSHGAGRRFCMGLPGVNKAFYGILSLALHFFKFERAPLDEEEMKKVFPSYRAASQTSAEMDPIKDQVGPAEAQSAPRATGVRVTARDPEKLAAWLEEGHMEMQDWIAPWE